MISARKRFLPRWAATSGGVTLRRSGVALVAAILVGTWQPLQAAVERADAVAAPLGASSATLVRAEEPSTVMDVSIWLNRE